MSFLMPHISHPRPAILKIKRGKKKRPLHLGINISFDALSHWYYKYSDPAFFSEQNAYRTQN